MKSLDEVKAEQDTIMTKELIRLFAAAGCKPTRCHACCEKIVEGDVFKLIQHTISTARLPHETVLRIPQSLKEKMDVQMDEMCCAKCGEDQLRKRDKKNFKEWRITRTGGFSRPSTPQEPEHGGLLPQ